MLTSTLEIICPACDFLNTANSSHCQICGCATLDVPEMHPLPPGLQPQAQPASNGPTSAPYRLHVIAGPSRGQCFTLEASQAQIGRLKGEINFPNDPFVSLRHALLFVQDEKLFVRNEQSTSGVFVSINDAITIQPGSLFAAGIRLFHYAGPITPNTPWNGNDVIVYGAPLPENRIHYSVQEVLIGSRLGRCLVTAEPVLSIGQQDCNFSYPHDESLARRHCELAFTPTEAIIRDLSGNFGTFIQIQSEWRLNPGDKIRIGQQILKVEI